MRTNEERIRLIHERTAQIKKKDEKKRRIEGILSFAACILLVIAAGVAMPGMMAGMKGGSANYVSGAASLVGSNAALGYILMGLLSFLMGVSVTILLYRLRRRREHRRQEKKKDEF